MDAKRDGEPAPYLTPNSACDLRQVLLRKMELITASHDSMQRYDLLHALLEAMAIVRVS